jgi:archaetidylinositol phosphate synthase
MYSGSLTRLNEGLFRGFERPALSWLAPRLPRWVTPDFLTFVGVVGAVVTFLGYAFSRSHPSLLWLAILGLMINWFGDSLDGTLARYRKIERPRYGYFLDNAIDCVAALLLALGIGISGYVRFDLCFMALSAYTMMSALTFLRANVTGVFHISYGGMGPTELRVAFVVLNLLILIFPPAPFDLFGLTFKYPDMISLTWFSTTIVAFVLCMVAQTRQLAIEEPARQREPSLRELGALIASPNAASSHEPGALANEA